MKRYTKQKIRTIQYVLGGTYLALLITVGLIALMQHQLWSYQPLLKNNLWFQGFGLFISILPALWLLTGGNKDLLEILQIKTNYIQGERGEDEVYKQIRKLEPEFKILKNIVFEKESNAPTQKAETENIDFVVIGHNGITAIEVKNYTKLGTLILNKKNDGCQVRHGAGLINNKLKYKFSHNYVNTLLVYAGNNRNYNKFQMCQSGEKTLAVGCEYVNCALLGQKGNCLSQAEIKNITTFLGQFTQK
ncbi:NERD domain-containing protein [Candidatus Uhrbacteria bacterium]|nr:NERD domain-containing protein [Candidatus Uhrbacteria bacterium]